MGKGEKEEEEEEGSRLQLGTRRLARILEQTEEKEEEEESGEESRMANESFRIPSRISFDLASHPHLFLSLALPPFWGSSNPPNLAKSRMWKQLCLQHLHDL